MNARKNKIKKNNLPQVKLHKLDWLEWISVILCIWFLVYPHPYKILFSVILCLPILGLILNGLSNPSLASLVSISKSNEEVKYDLADFIEFPGLILLIRVLIDYEFESIISILKVGTLAFVIVLLLMTATHRSVERSNKNKGLIYFTVIGNIALYSYAATYGVNCVYDQSAPKVYSAKVVDKSISHGRRQTTYYLRVEPWGPHREAENISVARSQYEETTIGQRVSIDYMEGCLNIPWYFIE